jgi:hypothetical protein
MFDDVKKLIEEARNLQIGDALITGGNLSIKLGEFYNAILRGEKFAMDDGELNKSIGDLEACCDDIEKSPKGAVDPKQMDPATILFIVKSVLEVLKAIREWRKKRDPQPA